jgi:hypothetical protein
VVREFTISHPLVRSDVVQMDTALQPRSRVGGLAGGTGVRDRESAPACSQMIEQEPPEAGLVTGSLSWWRWLRSPRRRLP